MRVLGELLMARILPIGLVILFLIIWQLVIHLADVPVYLMPSPERVFMTLVTQFSALIEYLGYTSIEAAGGLMFGVIVAIIVGLFSARFSLVETTVMPLAVFVKVTPVLAIAPLFAIWFGFGFFPRFLIVAVVTFFPILVNTIAGLKATSRPIMEYFESLGVSKWEILIKIRIPYSLPYVFAALKVAIPLSIIGAVIGEWFGSSKGLGNLIMVSHGNLDTETLFASIFLLAMLGVIATSVVAVVERRFIFWHPSVGTF